jgi:hypothetical protein
MAKLTLDNGKTLRIKAVRNSEGAVDIIVWDGLDRDDYWFIGSVETNGILHIQSDLEECLTSGLQYEADGGIKVERE